MHRVIHFPTEEKILRNYLPDEPTDMQILTAILSIDFRSSKVRPQLGDVMQSVIVALRSELHDV